jgi:hypothetical protein
VAVVERDRIAGEAGVGGDDGDDAAGEEALVELPHATVEVDGAVLADAAAAMDGERSGERRLVDGAATRAGPRLGRGLAEQPAVRRARSGRRDEAPIFSVPRSRRGGPHKRWIGSLLSGGPWRNRR